MKKVNPAYNPYEILRKVLLPYWPIFAISVAGTYLIGKTYLRFQLAEYQVFARLLIKDDGGIESALLKELNIQSPTKSVDNEIEILKSSNITDDIARNINAYVRITQKGNFQSIVMPHYFPIRFEALNEDSLVELPSKIIRITEGGEYFTIDDKKYQAKTQLVNFNGHDFRMEVDPIKLKNELTTTDYKLEIIAPNIASESIGKRLTAIKVGKNTTIIEVSFIDPNVQNATQILNEVLNVYTEASVIEKRKSAQYSLDFIDQRLRLINGELDSVEQNIQNYKSINGIVDISSQAALYLSNVKETDKQLASLNLQFSILEDIEKYIKGKFNNTGIVPSMIGLEGPLLNTLLQDLYRLESELSKRRKISGSRDEVYIGIEEEIAKTKRGIKENIANIRSNLNVTKYLVDKELLKQNALLSGLPQQEKTLVDISRQQNIKNQIYTFLLQKREESAISYAATVSDIRIIERAFGGTQVGPKTQLIYVICVSLGLLIPFILLYIWKFLSPKIQYRDEITYLTDVPILGEIINDPEKRKIVVGMKDRGMISESMRTLRTKLGIVFKGLSKKDVISGEQAKFILVSSSIPGEGKTFVSINLGVSYSLTGKKVVLIGADMRKPTLHKVFDINSRNGLSSYLSGTVDVERIIFPTAYDNLFIIPSGVIPPNPTELFESSKMDELFQYLKSNFDVIILDTPPLGLVSDAELLAKYAEMTLFVVRQNKTFKEAIIEVINKANDSGNFQNMGIIFNGIKPNGIGRYAYYGYGYGGYGYGYGYGYSGYGYYGGGVKKTGYGYYFKSIFKGIKK
jgi:capsular exopolysaccharide synthesis family protein